MKTNTAAKFSHFDAMMREGSASLAADAISALQFAGARVNEFRGLADTGLDAERLNAFLALAFDTLEAQRKAGKPRLSQVERAVDSVVNYLDALEG